jgi:hypothetical protein
MRLLKDVRVLSPEVSTTVTPIIAALYKGPHNELDVASNGILRLAGHLETQVQAIRVHMAPAFVSPRSAFSSSDYNTTNTAALISCEHLSPNS